MVVWLLAGILVAVLLCSEPGRVLLGWAFLLAIAGGVLYVLGWIAIIGFAFLSQRH